MTEYGEKLVEAGARKLMDALTLKGDVSASERALVRVLYGAFLDKLIEEGPSHGIDRAFKAAYDGAPGGSGHALGFDDAWAAMLKALRTEIDASDQARKEMGG